jgi:hypothetical protein
LGIAGKVTGESAEVGGAAGMAEGADEVPGKTSSSNTTCRRAFRDPRLTLRGRRGGSIYVHQMEYLKKKVVIYLKVIRPKGKKKFMHYPP